MARAKKAVKKTKNAKKSVKAKSKSPRSKKAPTTRKTRKQSKKPVKAKRSYTRRAKPVEVQVQEAKIQEVAVDTTITQEQLNDAKNAVGLLNSYNLEHMRTAFKSVDKKDWSKFTHIVINGNVRNVVTLALAEVLGVN